jgi:hypothetical protein
MFCNDSAFEIGNIDFDDTAHITLSLKWCALTWAHEDSALCCTAFCHKQDPQKCVFIADALIKRSKALTCTLATSNRPGPLAWMYFTSVYQKSVGYPLAVSRLSSKHLHHIQGPMIPLILNRIGYEQRLSRKLTFGPQQFGGLGIPHLLSYKIVSQIKLVMPHLRTPRQPHLLSQVNISRLQQIAGISKPVLESPHLRLPHLEGSWLTHFRESLTTIRASIQIANLRPIPLQRSHDAYIMDSILSSQQFSDREIRFINYCRFYVQALSLSDLCMAAGTHLQPGIRDCALPSTSISKLSEPYQELPGPLAWRAWRRLLRLISKPKWNTFSSSQSLAPQRTVSLPILAICLLSFSASSLSMASHFLLTTPSYPIPPLQSHIP